VSAPHKGGDVVRHAAAGLIIAVAIIGCQKKEAAPGAGDTGVVGATDTATVAPMAKEAPMPTAPATTDEGKTAEARSAAPDNVSRDATVMDWPATEGGQMRELAKGSNGWVCYPSTPSPKGAIGQDPMCLDPVFQKWAEAWMTKKSPNITAVGFGYMLHGDRGASNTDPFATDSTATNNWVRVGPHVMVVAPGATLASVSATPGKSPWVMWKGTPYAHVMMPVR
jgi:hypothetical protein